MRTACAGLLLALSAVGLFSACEKDPNAASTWVDQLDDRQARTEAIRHLQRINDPASIKPLGEAWKKSNKADSNVLRAMIDIAGKTKWDDALPFLEDAVENYDTGSSRSIDDAVVACDALGRSESKDAITVVLKAAQKAFPVGHEGNNVRSACILALGHYKDARVVDTLIKILETDPAPRLAGKINGAAALALADTGDPKALPALVKSMMFQAIITQQIRPAIARIGKPAVQPMIDLFQHKNSEIETRATKEKWYDEGKTPGQAPGNVVFRAASELGDLRAREATGMLAAELKNEPKIAFYDPRTTPPTPGPTTHQGVLGALQVILDTSVAPQVRAYMVDAKTDDGIRPFAIEVYGWLADDTSGLDDLKKWAKDEAIEPNIRESAIRSYGRVARTADQAKFLDDLMADQDKKMKTAEDKGKAAKKDDDKAAADRERQGYQYWKDRMQESRYRISAAIDCNADAACYVKMLPPTVKDLKPDGPNLWRAERALVELARLGDKASGQLDTLLKAADNTDRTIRQGILLVLPRVAPVPCAKCVDALGKVIEKQQGTQTLDFLTNETKVVYHLYLSGGKGTPAPAKK